ncbi:hypothetical protein Dimus_013158 [Dionaea muscipula]
MTAFCGDGSTQVAAATTAASRALRQVRQTIARCCDGSHGGAQGGERRAQHQQRMKRAARRGLASFNGGGRSHETTAAPTAAVGRDSAQQLRLQLMMTRSGENRRRDDDVDTPEEEAEEEEEGNPADFDWEAVIDEAAVEGESRSGEKFYDAEDKDQGSPEVNNEIPAAVPQDSAQQKEKESSGVDPSCPTGRIPEAVMLKFQAEFERTRANRFQADLEKAQTENARLLALLHQAQSKTMP